LAADANLDFFVVEDGRDSERPAECGDVVSLGREVEVATLSWVAGSSAELHAEPTTPRARVIRGVGRSRSPPKRHPVGAFE